MRRPAGRRTRHRRPSPSSSPLSFAAPPLLAARGGGCRGPFSDPSRTPLLTPLLQAPSARRRTRRRRAAPPRSSSSAASRQLLGRRTGHTPTALFLRAAFLSRSSSAGCRCCGTTRTSSSCPGRRTRLSARRACCTGEMPPRCRREADATLLPLSFAGPATARPLATSLRPTPSASPRAPLRPPLANAFTAELRGTLEHCHLLPNPARFQLGGQARRRRRPAPCSPSATSQSRAHPLCRPPSSTARTFSPAPSWPRSRRQTSQSATTCARRAPDPSARPSDACPTRPRRVPDAARQVHRHLVETMLLQGHLCPAPLPQTASHAREGARGPERTRE